MERLNKRLLDDHASDAGSFTMVTTVGAKHANPRSVVTAESLTSVTIAWSSLIVLMTNNKNERVRSCLGSLKVFGLVSADASE